MEETRIEFETAKLAYEKGFNNKLKQGLFSDDGKFHPYMAHWLMNYTEFFDAPTQTILQKWLREIHKIHVSPRESLAITGELEYVCTVNGKYVNHGIVQKPINRFDTWEQALEQGLQEGLNLIEVKGEKHSSSKVKTLAAVDVEKLENIQSFVEYAVTESRFKQALENVFPNDEPIENKKLGDVIRWVVNDVVKEEMDTMVENKIEPKDVNKYLSSKVREMFFKLV